MKTFLVFMLFIPIMVFGQITQIGQDIAPFSTKYKAFSGNGERFAVASDISSSTSSHTVKVYQLESNVWVQLGEDIDVPASSDDYTTMSAMRFNEDGNILVCSTSISWAPNEKIIKVFQYLEDGWEEIASLEFTFSESERVSGLKISNDGNTIILVNGSTSMASDWTTSGFVFVIENISGTYQHTEIFGYNHIENAHNDVDMSSDGSTIVISQFAGWSTDMYGSAYLDDHKIDVIRKNSTNNEWEEISSTTFDDPGLSTKIATNINGSSLITTVDRYDQSIGWVNDLRVYEIGENSISQIGTDFRFRPSFTASPSLNKLAYTTYDEAGNRVIRFRENNTDYLAPIDESIALGLEFGAASKFNNTGNRVLVNARDVTTLDYYVKVYDFGESLSIDDSAIFDITIGPNPANQNITIKSDGSLHLNKATIYDLIGRLVKVFNFQNNRTEETIDVSQLNSAVYLIKIESDSGHFTKRLIID